MRDYEAKPGEARWSVWMNRHPAVAITLTVLVLAIGIALMLARRTN
jgi:hypothetical protein